MNSTFILTIVVVGLSGVIAQILLLRELLVSFYGNELTIGIVLANWVISEAIGVLIAGKLIDKIKDCVIFYQESNEHSLDYKEGISEIIICGGGAHLKGLSQYLSARLKIPVKLGNPWVNIPYPKNKIPAIPYDESPDYATVLGLALRGVEIKC